MAKFEVKGIKELENKFNSMIKTIDKYNGSNEIELPYSQEEWNKMDEISKQNAIDKAKEDFIQKIQNELFT